MNSIKLTTTDRDNSSQSVPGVVYGPDLSDNIHLQAEYNDLYKVLVEAGANKIVQINVGGADHEVLFKDVQYDPISNDVIHFDMYAIKRGQKIKANIPVVLIGASPAVLKGAVLNQFIDELEVECIPSKLPESFEIDISSIDEVGDAIGVESISQVEGVDILGDSTTIVKAEEVKAMKVEDDGPVDGPSDEDTEGNEEGSTPAAEEGTEDAESAAEDKSTE